MSAPPRPALTAAALLAALLCLAATGSGRAGTLDRALLGEEFASVLAEIDRRKYRDVGVLPFQVKKGSRPASYTAAPLCQDLPRRIENALIMSMKVAHERIRPIGIIRDAAATAREGKVGAYTRDEQAFRKLFAQRYRLAWGGPSGDEWVEARAFLHGTVESVGDRRTTLLKVELFDRECWKDGKIVPGKTWQIPIRTDRALLADLGYGLSLSRDAFGNNVSTKERDEAAAKQVTEEDEKARPPAEAGLASTAHTPPDVGGFSFELRYDGKPAPLAALRGGVGAGQPEFEAPPAPPGGRISMRMVRKDADPVLKGVVLLVNGKSTIEEESGDLLRLRRWTVAPSERGKSLTWDGYYYGTQGEKKKPFRALTPTESVARAAEYGTHAGWIHVHIFVSKPASPTIKQQPAKEKPTAPPADKDEAETALLFSTRTLPKGQFKTFNGLRAQLMRANGIVEKKGSKKARALMRNGALIVPEVAAVPVEAHAHKEFPNPELIASLAIRYYAPGGREIDKKDANE